MNELLTKKEAVDFLVLKEQITEAVFTLRKKNFKNGLMIFIGEQLS